MPGEERRIATWSERPYTSHRRRGVVVQHRVLFVAYDHGVDVQHQVRSSDKRATVPETWTDADVWEIRGGRVTKALTRRVP